MTEEKKFGFTMRELDINKACPSVCDVCGKTRGGDHKSGRKVSHVKCSKIRQARGFIR